MCGIAGTYGPRAADREVVARMISALHHRGPDGSSTYVDGPVGLGHARLSIIDLATGDQPVGNEDGSVQVVFNGEIFNYVELRATLRERGHVFATQSDTETIVHAYEEYGDAFVEHLNGQFAIALWDRRRARLVLARDRLGVRPLYYSRRDGMLSFASEVKALVAGTGKTLRPDPSGIAQCFTFWAPLGTRTPFEGVESLRAAHLMIADSRGVEVRRYWSWDASRARVRRDVSMAEAAAEVRALLDDAVRLQLRSDVPVGAYLSGGLDSSAIVALARRHAGSRLRTFSVAFEDAEFDETPYQRQAVEFFGTDHTTIRCTTRDLGAVFPRVVEHAEAPLVRTGPAPLMLLSGLVRRSGYKVVLTGEGADEVYAGYDLFKEARIRRFWARAPQSRWRAALLSRLYPYMERSPVANPAFAAAFFRPDGTPPTGAFYAHAPRAAASRRIWNVLSPEFRAAIGDWRPESQLEPLLPAGFDDWHGLGRDQYVEAESLLYGYLLSSQGDRVAMANSVEGRVPFLDHRVVEHANSLPPRLKLAGLREKAVLREALRDVLPPALGERTKQPYRAPDAASFFVDGRPLDYVAEALSRETLDDAGIFDAGAVERLVAKCAAGRGVGQADNMAFVGTLSTMLLHRRFMRADAARAKTECIGGVVA